MKQLDPKAIWLFFISRIFTFGFLALIIGGWFGNLFISLKSPDYYFNEPSLWLPFEINWSLIFLLALLVIIVSFVIAKLTYHYYRYEMSDLVFKKEHGIIWKKYVSIPYDRIQNVDIYRGIWARLLGLSDIQIQTAGGITAGSYGAFSEGRLIGVSKEEAEKLRNELIQRARNSRSGQGL
ncbi:MAG: PH domain-containing protein [Patescibacteria group bacterium]